MMPASEPSNLDKLQAPAVLRELKQWLVWKFEPNPKPGKKDLKVPHYAKSGTKRGWFPGVRGVKIGQGSAEEMPLLVTFEEAKAAAIQRGMEGVGLAMVEGCPVTALDFDHCVVDGAIDPEVERLIIGTYAEISPSGTGVRAFVQGNLGDRSDAHPDDGSFGFETYASSRFVTFTGNMTADTVDFGCENEISQPSTLLLEACEKRFGPKVIRQVSIGKSDKERVGLTDDQIKIVLQYTAIGDYHRWMSIGASLHHETEGEGEWLWDEWSQLGADYEGPDEIRYKWSTMGKYSGNEKTFWSVLREAQAQGCPIDVDTASPDEFEDLGADKSKPAGYHGFFSIDEFEGQDTKVHWFIKGFLPRAQLAILFGPSGSGKSFLAFDLCAAIARGLETWNGKRVTKGRVAYLVAEGVPGFRQRIKAYRAEHAIKGSDIDMTIIAGIVPNLTDEASVARLKTDMKKFGPFDLIVFDTFAQVTSGANENSGEAMGTALKHCREISQVCGAMTLLVHHSGKDDTKGARGWSGLKAAADVELEVKRDKDGAQRSVTITKMKDGEDNAAQGFKLRSVVMGKDEDGDDITSCVVEYNEAGQVSKAQKLGHNQATLMRALADLQGFNSGRGIEEEKLIAATVGLMHLKEGARQDMRPTRARESLTALIGSKCVFVENGLVCAAKADE
jgi:hypothetical protein